MNVLANKRRRIIKRSFFVILVTGLFMMGLSGVAEASLISFNFEGVNTGTHDSMLWSNQGIDVNVSAWVIDNDDLGNIHNMTAVLGGGIGVYGGAGGLWGF